jgi:hypothetical protein
MSSVAEIIAAVRQLTENDKGAFLEQLAEVDFDDAWDRQIAADARGGKLDFLWEEAQREIAAGVVRPLDEIFHHE